MDEEDNEIEFASTPEDNQPLPKLVSVFSRKQTITNQQGSSSFNKIFKKAEKKQKQFSSLNSVGINFFDDRYILKYVKKKDINDRTLIHRSALAFEIDIFRKICQLVFRQKNSSTPNALDNLSYLDVNDDAKLYKINKGNFIQVDTFGYKPLICACIYPQSNEKKKENARIEFFKIFYKIANEDKNIFEEYGKKTVWPPIFWVCFHEEEESLKFLLEKNVKFWVPDRKGYFPIDIVGKKENKNLTTLFINKFISKIEKLNDSEEGDQGDNEEKRKINSVLLHSVMLYWAIYCDHENIKKLIEFGVAVPELSLYKVRKQNCFHACAIFNDNSEHLKFLIYYTLKLYESQQKKPISDSLKSTNRLLFNPLKTKNNAIPINLKNTANFSDMPFSFQINFIYPFSEDNKTILQHYSNKFLDYLSDSHNWCIFRQKKIKSFEGDFYGEMDFHDFDTHILVPKLPPDRNNFLNNIKKTILKDVNLFDAEDLLENQPIHYAAIKNHPNVLQILINIGSRLQKPNKIGLPAREYVHLDTLKQKFREYEKNISEEKMIDLQKLLVGEKLLRQNSPSRKSWIQSQAKLTKKLFVNLYNKIKIKENKLQFIELFNEARGGFEIPEYIIKFTIIDQETKKKKSRMQQIFQKIMQVFLKKNNADQKINTKMSEEKKTIMNYCLNNYVSKGIDVNLVQSDFDFEFYAMLAIKTDKLMNHAESLEIEIKRNDHGRYEKFQEKNYSKFEPFRSKQRVEIISKIIHSSRSLDDLELLLKNKIVFTYFPMHKPGAHRDIKNLWIGSIFQIPAPLSEYKSYLFEIGNDKTFKSLDCLQRYFGERVAFLFGWLSYSTVTLTILAFIGVIVWFFISDLGDWKDNELSNFELAIIFIWITIVSVSFSVISEGWKRRSYEINHLWGTSDMLVDGMSREIRKSFEGQEIVIFSQRRLTKKNEKKAQKLVWLIFIPIFIILIAIYFVIFYFVERWKSQRQSEYIIKIIAGSINSIAISILNIGYYAMSKYFVLKENHETESEYQRSLIIKFFPFRFITAYIGVFYIAFFKPLYLLEKNVAVAGVMGDVFNFLWPLLIAKQIINSILMVNFSSNQFTKKQLALPQIIYTLKKRNYFKKNSWNTNIINDNNASFDRQSSMHSFFRLPSSSVVSDEKISTLRNSKKRFVYNCNDGKPTNKEWFIDYVEMNTLRKDYPGDFHAYVENIISFGYVTMFAAAFPIGPLIYVVNNLIEIRWRILSLVNIYKRPFPEKFPTIGLWQHIWEFMSIIAVLTNFGILNVGFLPQNTILGSWSEFEILLFSLAFEHVIIGGKFFLQWAIPDKPSWITHHEIKQQLKKEYEYKNIIGSAEGPKIQEQDSKDRTSRNLEISKQDSDDTTISTNQISIQKKSLKNSPTDLKKSVIKSSENGCLMLTAFIDLEKLILNRQMNLIAGHVESPYIICKICQLERAITECFFCADHYCSKCFVSFHQNNDLQNHIPILLTGNLYKLDENIHKLEMEYGHMTRPATKKMLDPIHSKIIDKNLTSVTAEISKIKCHSQNEFNKSFIWKDLLSEYERIFKNKDLKSEMKNYSGLRIWKKFQYFSFPSPDTENGKETIETIFDNFTHYYLAVSDYKNLPNSSLSNFAKFLNSDELWKKKKLIIENIDFNLHELYLLNRFYFIIQPKIWEKSYSEADKEWDLKNFGKFLAKMMSNSFEQRLRAFLSIADEDFSFSIRKQSIQNILSASFMHEIMNSHPIDELINLLYGSHTVLTKAELFSNILHNTEIKRLFSCFLQVSQN